MLRFSSPSRGKQPFTASRAQDDLSPSLLARLFVVFFLMQKKLKTTNEIIKIQAVDLAEPPSVPFWQLRSWSLLNRFTGAPESATEKVVATTAETATSAPAAAAAAKATTPKATTPGPAAPSVAASAATLLINAQTFTITGTGFDASSPSLNAVVLSKGAVGQVTAATATSLTVALTRLPQSAGPLTAVVVVRKLSSGEPSQVATVSFPESSGLPESARWRAVAASQEGSKLVAVAQGGAIWTSKDRGATWKASTTAPIAAGYVTVASSADGSKIVAGVNPGGKLWLSSDSGASFAAAPLSTGGSSNSSLPAFAPWNAVAIDKSGTTIAAGEDPGKLWIGNDFGAAKSWTAPQPASGSKSSSSEVPVSAPYTYVVVARDGQRISACSFRGTIYSSADAGKTWVAQKGAPSAALWQGLASSSDGTTLVAADQSPGSLWISKDAGATFVAVAQTSGAPVSARWRHVSSTDDGKALAAVVEGGGIWRSSDAGASWKQLGGGLPAAANWHHVTMSAGGSVMAAVSNGGKVWVSYDAGASWTSR